MLWAIPTVLDALRAGPTTLRRQPAEGSTIRLWSKESADTWDFILLLPRTQCFGGPGVEGGLKEPWLAAIGGTPQCHKTPHHKYKQARRSCNRAGDPRKQRDAKEGLETTSSAKAVRTRRAWARADGAIAAREGLLGWRARRQADLPLWASVIQLSRCTMLCWWMSLSMHAFAAHLELRFPARAQETTRTRRGS